MSIRSEAFIEAFRVMLELRQCTGVIPYVAGNPVWFIKVNTNIDGLGYGCVASLCGKLYFTCFSPAFNNEQSAIEAVYKIGPKRILNAAKTLANKE